MPILPEGVHTPGRLTPIAAQMLIHARRTWPGITRLHPTALREIQQLIDDFQTSAQRNLTASTKADAPELRAVSTQPGRFGTSEAAQALGCSEQWMRERAAGGDLGASKDRGRWTYDAEAVLAEAQEEQRRRV
jgi:hypothetical protein